MDEEIKERNLFFELINSILYKKKKLTLDELEELGYISPFVLNNWLSSYSPDLLKFVNNTSNMDVEFFRNKENLYNYYYNVIPKVKYKKLSYPKNKTKKDDNKIDEEILTFLSKHLELSKNDIKYLIEREAIDISTLKN